MTSILWVMPNPNSISEIEKRKNFEQMKFTKNKKGDVAWLVFSFI